MLKLLVYLAYFNWFGSQNLTAHAASIENQNSSLKILSVTYESMYISAFAMTRTVACFQLIAKICDDVIAT